VPTLTRAAFGLAQGVLGVGIGSYVRASTLATIGSHWLSIVLVCAATLAVSVALGLVLTAISPVDRATASVGMIAGGAAGIVSISDELGADDRLVVVMQYLRVLLIVTFMPFVATAVFHASAQGASVGVAAHGLPGEIAFLAVCLGVGLPIGVLARVPAGALIGPMVLSTATGFVDASLVRPVPAVLTSLALALIGLQVGLRFTPASLRAAGSLLPVATLFILLLIVACALLGVLLAELAHVDQLDAYLATTPGGLYVVLATAVTGGANGPFVLSVQLLRTFLMLLVAPPLVRWLAGRPLAAAVPIQSHNLEEVP
jgi:membrane AbrB-like protein